MKSNTALLPPIAQLINPINGTDTNSTCLPNSQLRRAIAANEQYKLLKEQNALKDSLLATYDSTLIAVDSLLASQRFSLTLLKQKVNKLEQVAAGKEAYIGLQETDIKQLNGQLTKAKWNKWLAYGVAVLASIAALSR